jgi:hypothetical protein
MKEFKIPAKLINMCKTYVQKTRGAVRIEGPLLNPHPASFYDHVPLFFNDV